MDDLDDLYRYVRSEVGRLRDVNLINESKSLERSLYGSTSGEVLDNILGELLKLRNAGYANGKMEEAIGVIYTALGGE